MQKACKEIPVPLRYTGSLTSFMLHALFLPSRTNRPSAETQFRIACSYFCTGFPSFLRKEPVLFFAKNKVIYKRVKLPFL